METPESTWLAAGFYWISIGALASLPYIATTWLGAVGRVLFDLTIVVHVIEALYCLELARRGGLDGAAWFRRALFLGYFAVRRLRMQTSVTA